MRHFTFFDLQSELGVFDRPHTFGKSVWINGSHLTDLGYEKLGALLADKIVEIDEKELQNGNLEDFGTACLPDLKNSHYWSIRKFYRNNFYEFVRTGALSPQHKMRWLSFKLKEEMKKGKTYRITFCIKYSEDVEVQVFLHGPGQIEKFPKQELYAEQWTKFSTQYTVAYEDLQYFGMTASSFITAGNALAVSYIEVIEVEE